LNQKQQEANQRLKTWILAWFPIKKYVKKFHLAQRFSIHFEAGTPLWKKKSFLHHLMYCFLYHQRSFHP